MYDKQIVFVLSPSYFSIVCCNRIILSRCFVETTMYDYGCIKTSHVFVFLSTLLN